MSPSWQRPWDFGICFLPQLTRAQFNLPGQWQGLFSLVNISKAVRNRAVAQRAVPIAHFLAAGFRQDVTSSGKAQMHCQKQSPPVLTAAGLDFGKSSHPVWSDTGRSHLPPPGVPPQAACLGRQRCPWSLRSSQLGSRGRETAYRHAYGCGKTTHRYQQLLLGSKPPRPPRNV